MIDFSSNKCKCGNELPCRKHRKSYYNILLAMEWGFKAHEKGMNFEMAKNKFIKEFAEGFGREKR